MQIATLMVVLMYLAVCTENGVLPAFHQHFFDHSSPEEGGVVVALKLQNDLLKLFCKIFGRKGGGGVYNPSL